MKRIKNITGKRILVSDLSRGHSASKDQIERAILRVLDSGWYVLGLELEAFEREFARYNGSRYAVGVASGTEAIQIALMALGIGRGDEVITIPNTAIPTAMAIVAAGATPRFVDVREDTQNIDETKLKESITKKTKAIIPVHLYGNPCEIEGVLRIAGQHGLYVVEDACQAHGASYNGKKVGTFGDLGAFSFYPTKNLGCYGDGGMIVTDDRKLAETVKLLRNYGQKTRYACDMEGINSRLDEIQAAILRVKLRRLNSFNKRRRHIAALYQKCLAEMGEMRLPMIGDNTRQGVFHLYVIRCQKRDALRSFLAKRGIETQIHYPVPLHLQKAFAHLGYSRGDFPVAEKLVREILSLPIFPELTDREVVRISALIRKWYGYPR